MKILLGVDGSDGSLDAVRQVAAMASAPRDEVALYYSPPLVRFHEADANTPQMQSEARQALASAVFNKAKEQLPEALRATVHTIVGSQPPRAGLLLAADDWRADLIALGARGTGPIATVKLGGVARHVARSANVPVLVTRHVSRPAGTPLRVLYATDFSDASRQAASALCHASWSPDTIGYLMTVAEPFFPTAMPEWLAVQARDAETEAMSQGWVVEHDADVRQKHADLAALAKTLPAAFQKEPPIVAEGHAAEQILKTVADKSIHLVIVGAQGKSAFTRFMIGSTSETLLAQAPCSVLVVRRRETP
jgi:nucleotide-binding universal stress UspA family protein